MPNQKETKSIGPISYRSQQVDIIQIQTEVLNPGLDAFGRTAFVVDHIRLPDGRWIEVSSTMADTVCPITREMLESLWQRKKEEEGSAQDGARTAWQENTKLIMRIELRNGLHYYGIWRVVEGADISAASPGRLICLCPHDEHEARNTLKALKQSEASR